jgi:hypothetical protein
VDIPEYTFFISCAIGAITHYLAKLPPSTAQSEITAVLDLGKRLSWLSRDTDYRASCLRSLGEASASLSHACFRKGLYEAGAKVARQSVEITNSAIAAHRESGKPLSSDWRACLASRWKTYDNLTQCLSRSGDREVSPILMVRRPADKVGRHTGCDTDSCKSTSGHVGKT